MAWDEVVARKIATETIDAVVRTTRRTDIEVTRTRVATAVVVINTIELTTKDIVAITKILW